MFVGEQLRLGKAKSWRSLWGTNWEEGQFPFTAFSSQACLQRIHQGLVFYEKLLGSDIFTGEPSLLPDGPVSQLHASLLGLRQLLQVSERLEHGSSRSLTD